MRVIGRRMSQRNVLSGTDEVVAGFPLAPGGQLNNVWIKCSGSGATFNIPQAVMYGLTGFVVPLLDPDNVVTYEAIWDAQIPKDVANAAGVFDLDTEAADANPEFQPGRPDFSAVFQMASGDPKEIFRRRELVTFGKRPVAYADLATDQWVPTFAFDVHVSRQVRVETPSVVLFGFSNPNMGATTTSEPDSLTEKQWVQYTYLEMTLEQAWMNLVGLVEAGSETPWEEAAALVTELIERALFEENADYFQTGTWTVYTEATFDVSVPGRYEPGVLTSE